MSEYTPAIALNIEPGEVYAPSPIFTFAAAAAVSFPPYQPSAVLVIPLMAGSTQPPPPPVPARTTGQLWPISA